MKIIAYFSLLLMYISYACSPVPEIEINNYVVEGYLFAGRPVREITIKTLIPLSNPEGKSEVIETAMVMVKKEDETFPLTFNPNTGMYEYKVNDLDVLPLDVLELEVDVNGRIATATTTVPTPPVGLEISKNQMVIPKINSGADFLNGNPLEDAEILASWRNPDQALHYAVIEFRGNTLEPILPPDVQEVVDGILEDFAIITVPSTDTTLTVLGATLPSYGQYVITVYKVNQEYADLYKSETQDSRDLNDPPSNIINARGIFSAFAGDSIFFEVILP
jgi:Domain of unknown function (DUF4249)